MTLEDFKETEHGSRINGVEFIWARNSKEFLFANSILIYGKPSIIVDPSATFTYIESLAMSHKVDIVLNTHYHGDHRSLNGIFKNVIYASHKDDAKAIRDYNYYEEIADTDPTSFYTEWRKQVFKKYHIVDCPVSKLLNDGDVIDTGEAKVEIVHIPGHTPGHIALLFPDVSTLFLSDIDLTPYGPWYANVVSDIDQFIASVKKIKEIKVDHYVTSHGERIYDYEKFQEKINRFEQTFFDRDNRILEQLETGPKTMLDIAQQGIIYRRPSLKDPLKAYFQWQMILKHLDRFQKQNKIVKDGDYFKLA